MDVMQCLLVLVFASGQHVRKPGRLCNLDWLLQLMMRDFACKRNRV
jgi:hypothetical protein